eukprot:2122445-Rhodomonas_salina.3
MPLYCTRTAVPGPQAPSHSLALAGCRSASNGHGGDDDAMSGGLRVTSEVSRCGFCDVMESHLGHSERLIGTYRKQV